MPTKPSRLRLLLLVTGLAGMLAGPAGAEVFKCRDAQGRTRYGDAPCEGRREAYRPRELNQVPAEQLTGGRKPAASGRKPGWVSPLDPVANCEKQGGRFSREFRGCLLP